MECGQDQPPFLSAWDNLSQVTFPKMTASEALKCVERVGSPRNDTVETVDLVDLEPLACRPVEFQGLTFYQPERTESETKAFQDLLVKLAGFKRLRLRSHMLSAVQGIDALLGYNHIDIYAESIVAESNQKKEDGTDVISYEDAPWVVHLQSIIRAQKDVEVMVHFETRFCYEGSASKNDDELVLFLKDCLKSKDVKDHPKLCFCWADRVRSGVAAYQQGPVKFDQYNREPSCDAPDALSSPQKRRRLL
jgi:hypothetical protein